MSMGLLLGCRVMGSGGDKGSVRRAKALFFSILEGERGKNGRYQLCFFSGWGTPMGRAEP